MFQSHENWTWNTVEWKLAFDSWALQLTNTVLYLSKIFVVRQIVSCFWGLGFNSATNFMYLRFYNARERRCSRWIISLLISFLLLSMQRVWYLNVMRSFADLGLDCKPKIKCKGLPGNCFMFSCKVQWSEWLHRTLFCFWSFCSHFLFSQNTGKLKNGFSQIKVKNCPQLWYSSLSFTTLLSSPFSKGMVSTAVLPCRSYCLMYIFYPNC